MILEIYLAVACIIYILHYLHLYVGLRRSLQIPRAVPDRYPTISILVAARNEAPNIERCLRALLAQDYPRELVQIIAVNDESEDRTLAIMHRVADEYHGRLTVISTIQEETTARGKARAIAQGIDHATGEIILLTDADCSPPTVWARSVVEHFIAGVDLFGGFTLIEAHDFFSATQQLDWIHLQTLGSSALSVGFPVGVIGNNFAFRRAAYEHVGGYRQIAFTVTEDFALFRAMCDNGHKAVFPCARDTRMFSLPCVTLSEVLRQKQRWGRGATANAFPGALVLVFAVIMLIAFSIAPFVSLTAWAAVWSIKFACDLLILYPNMKCLGVIGQLRYFLLFELYYVAQSLVMPILIVNRTVVWKGRSYRS